MTTTVSSTPAAKRSGRRMQFVVNPTQERVLRRAAAAAGKPISTFVAESCSAVAYQLLIEDPDFQMDDPDWEHFLALLGQPASEKGQLQALLQSNG